MSNGGGQQGMYPIIQTDLLPSKRLKPVLAATSGPPPINWATKPRVQAATTNEQPLVQQTNSLSTPRRLIPIFIDPDDIGELQEAILRTLTNRTVPTFGHHEDNGIECLPSPPPIANIEEHAIYDSPSLHTSKSVDDSLDSTILTFANLTLSSPPSPQVSSSLTKKRYYVITVGKCAGVFYGEWYASVNLSNDRLGCFLTFLSRDNISHLVLGVSGARYKGFPTKEKADQAYRRAKNNGEVRIVREPNDDLQYGPIFYAIQPVV
jgi:hypothetical protein